MNYRLTPEEERERLAINADPGRIRTKTAEEAADYEAALGVSGETISQRIGFLFSVNAGNGYSEEAVLKAGTLVSELDDMRNFCRYALSAEELRGMEPRLAEIKAEYEGLRLAR